MSSHAELYLHFVWGTWRRLPMLVDGRRPGVYDAIRRICIDLRCETLALGGMPDHVHLVIRARADLAPSYITKKIKGASSYFTNPVHGEMASFRWQEGYGVFSLAHADLMRITRYVEDQERHHNAGTLWDALERMSDRPR